MIADCCGTYKTNRGHKMVTFVTLTRLLGSPNSSNPAIIQLHSFVLVETVLFSYHLDVQYLLHKELTMPASVVHIPSIIPRRGVITPRNMFSNGCDFSSTSPQLQSSFCSHSLHLKSLESLPKARLSTRVRDLIYYHGPLLQW